MPESRPRSALSRRPPRALGRQASPVAGKCIERRRSLHVPRQQWPPRWPVVQRGGSPRMRVRRRWWVTLRSHGNDRGDRDGGTQQNDVLHAGTDLVADGSITSSACTTPSSGTWRSSNPTLLHTRCISEFPGKMLAVMAVTPSLRPNCPPGTQSPCRDAVLPPSVRGSQTRAGMAWHLASVRPPSLRHVAPRC